MSLISSARPSRPRKLAARQRFAAAASSSSLRHVPLPVAVLLLTAFLPLELDFSLGGLRLNCARTALLVFLPIAGARLASGRDTRLRSFDYLFVGSYAWYALALFIKEPLETALQSGGIIFFEATSTYVLARAFIHNPRQFLATVKLLFILVLVAGALAIPESLMSAHWARDAAAALTGAAPVSWIDTRMGLARAMAVFDHPIHYGAFCASVFGLVWFTELDPFKRLIRAALIAGAGFFSLSAGPLQGMAFVLAGALWEKVTRRVQSRVWLTIVLFAALYLLASLFTNRPPFKILLTTLVFDPGSAYYRLLIWDYGIDNVIKNPMIGVPLHFWERPAWMPADSVDNHWLTIALWGGLPSVAMLALSIVMMLRAATVAADATEPPDVRGMRYGWSVTVLALCVVGATVAYWGSLQILFIFYLGLGGWLTELRAADRQAVSANAGRPRVLRRRRLSGGRAQRTSGTGVSAPAPPGAA